MTLFNMDARGILQENRHGHALVKSLHSVQTWTPETYEADPEVLFHFWRMVQTVNAPKNHTQYPHRSTLS